MINEALILAAGAGKRLVGISQGAKFEVKILGIPLAHYCLQGLIRVGVDKIAVVVRKGWVERFLETVEELVEDIDLYIIENPEPWRDNGYSFLLGSTCIHGERFFLTMVDHLLPVSLIKQLSREAEQNPRVHILVAGDKKPNFVDLREATKILASKDGDVVCIGKQLREYSHVDVGIFIVAKDVTKVAKKLEEGREVFGWSDVVNEAIKMGFKAKIVDVTGALWTEIDTLEDYESAHKGIRRVVVEELIKEWRRTG